MKTLEDWLRLCGVAMLGSLAVGCTESGPRVGGAGTGHLTVLLTDAPFPVDEVASVDVFVVRIDARLAEADEAEAAEAPDANDNTDPASGWLTVAEPNASYDLLKLQNGTTVNLGQATLPTGTYNGFRLILDTDKSSVTLKDGTVLDGNARPGIKWPSAGHSGLKIKLDQPISLVEDGTVLVIDFDLSRSFVMRGNTISKNGLLFKPVIKATARDLTGSLSGTVRAGTETGDLVAGATVEVLKPGTTLDDADAANVLQTTLTNDQGAYRFAFVLPGTYSLRAKPPAALTGFGPVLKEGIEVKTGTELGGTLLILPAKT